MAPRRGNNSNRGRKKLNIAAIRQNNDLRKYGSLHPTEEQEKTTTKYTKVKDSRRVKPVSKREESSSDSEEETPVIKQLMQEIGVKEEEEPESEQEDSEDEDSDNEGSDASVEEGEGEEDESDEEDVDEDGGSVGDEGNLDSLISHEAEDEEDNEEDESDGENGVERDEENESDDSFIDDESEEDDDESVDGSEEEQNPDENGNIGRKRRRIGSSSEEDNSLTEEPSLAKKSKKKDRSDQLGQKKQKENKDFTLDKDEEDIYKESDPFNMHFEIEVEEAGDFIEENKIWKKKEIKIPGLGKSILSYKKEREIETSTSLKESHVKHKLCRRAATSNTKHAGVTLGDGESLTPFQHKLFNTVNSYQDLLYPKENVENTEEIRMVYCLHALNHVLKARSRITAHNTKLKAKRGKEDQDDVEYRDHGLTKPKVVMLLPYREKAKKVVNLIIHLLSASEKLKAGSYNRFLEEFSEVEERSISARRYKAEDYLQLFEGNIDDNFRIGLSISKSNVRLYSPLYSADIIIASPLGLRTLIGDPGDEERDFDFLSSIEMLIMDQTDVFMMQNWDHVLHSLQHFHLQPKESHDVDFSRVRMWAIDGLSKYFRQTLIFSSVLLPELVSIYNKYCHNYCGKIMVQKVEKVGSVRSCLTDVPQVFHRVPCSRPDGTTQRNAKLEYFKKKILPLHTSAGMKRTIIYCNYFSFVMLRNLFREENIFFLFIHEYDREKDIKKNRKKFRKFDAPFMFYTERLHFHYRFQIRGVYHLVWFDVPQYPIYYPELVNLMDVNNQACTSTCLFTKYDGQKLLEIVGEKNATHMLNSEKSVNMITMS